MMNKRLIQEIPIIVLGLSLWAMVFHTVPETNEKYVLSIITGLLGFLARDAVNNSDKQVGGTNSE